MEADFDAGAANGSFVRLADLGAKRSEWPVAALLSRCRIIEAKDHALAPNGRKVRRAYQHEICGHPKSLVSQTSLAKPAAPIPSNPSALRYGKDALRRRYSWGGMRQP